jgi:hypothetical protein
VLSSNSIERPQTLHNPNAQSNELKEEEEEEEEEEDDDDDVEEAASRVLSFSFCFCSSCFVLVKMGSHVVFVSLLLSLS